VLDPFEYNLVSTPSPDSATSRSQGGVEWGLLCDCLFGGVERNKGSSGETGSSSTPFARCRISGEAR
jgi:hypothetical protein